MEAQDWPRHPFDSSALLIAVALNRLQLRRETSLISDRHRQHDRAVATNEGGT